MPAPSKRFEAIPPYLFAEIARVKREALAKGMDVIDLGIGDPDIPTPTSIRQALTRAVEDPATHRYDESAKGWDSFLEAAQSWYTRQFGVEIDSSIDLCQCIGSKEGLAHIAWSYIDEGDVSIVPNPGYTVYTSIPRWQAGRCMKPPLLEENDYLPALADIPTDTAKKAKLFYICYPHNPTAAVATKEFYRDAINFCKDHDILLVNDMAYATVTYDGYEHPTTLQCEGGKDVAIEFHSLSKMYNMTGWRLGFAIGSPDAVGTLQRLKSNLDSKQFPAVAEAGAYALNEVDNEADYAGVRSPPRHTL